MNPYFNPFPTYPVNPAIAAKPPIRKASNAIFGGLIIWTLAQLVVVFAFLFLLPNFDNMSDLMEQIYSITAYTLPFLLATWFMIVVQKVPANIALPLRKVKPDICMAAVGVSLGAIMVGIFMTNFFSVSFSLVFGYQPISPDMSMPQGIAPNILYFISIAILPAILEEAMFRGAILQSLRRFGDGFALVVSAILFGIAHGNFIQAPYSIVFGLVVGYFTLYTGSLIPGMIAHLFNNGLSVIMEWISTDLTRKQYDTLNYGYILVFLLAGIIGLFYLKIKNKSVFFVHPSKYPVAEKDKYFSFFSTICFILFAIYSIFMFLSYLEPVSY